MIQRWLPGLIIASILSSGCGSSPETFSSTLPASSTNNPNSNSSASSGKFLQDLREFVARLTTAEQLRKFVQPKRDTLNRLLNVSIPGPAGGTATLTGDFNIGASADAPATSVLAVVFSQLKFLDGLIVDGGTCSLTTVLWGSEVAAHGTVVLDVQNIQFSGIGSGTHSFKVELQLVNSKVINTIITFDGQRQEFGFVVKLVNHSTTPDNQVYVTLIGKDQNQSAWHYMAHPDDASMTEFEDTPGNFLSKNSNGSFIGAEKYSMALSEMFELSDHTYGLVVPRENVVSGRIFFSFGRKLQGVGINCPYYNTNGQPITQGSSATGSVVLNNDGKVTIAGPDATQSLAINEPVSYTVNGGPTVNAKITDVLSATQIKLDPAPTTAGSAAFTFTPDPVALNDAKLALSGPSPTGPPDYLTTFELMELSATTDPTAPDPFYTLFANTTAIDFFSIGLGMTVNFAGLPPVGGNAGVPPSEKSVGFATSVSNLKSGVSRRNEIFNRLNNIGATTPATPAEFQNFVTVEADPNPSVGVDPHLTLGKPVDGARTIIRALGPPPVVAVQPAGLLNAYLNSTITQQWPTFCQGAQALTGANAILFPLTDPAFTFEGTAPSSASTLNMKCTQAAGSNTGLNEVYQLPQPTTRMVFECDDTQSPGTYPNNYTNSGTDAHRRLCSIILAAFARGVFPNVADWSDHNKFYSDPNLKYNFFARVMHEFALDGIVYGFAYDDVYGQDSTIAGPIDRTQSGKVPNSKLGNVVDVILTIPNFTAPPPAALPGAPLTVQAIIPASKPPVSPEGCLVHFTTPDGKIDVNAPLSASGLATVNGLNSSTPYTVWISPGGPNASQWFYSYAANGQYDGTTGGTWNSSYSTNTPGVIQLQMGELVPGVGSILNPQPEAPRAGGLPPLPTANSNQSDWGN